MKRLFAGSEARFEHTCEIGLPARSSDRESVKESRDLEQRHECYDDRENDHHYDRYRIKQNLPEIDRRNVCNAIYFHHRADEYPF